jgi:hypothetical protein
MRRCEARCTCTCSNQATQLSRRLQASLIREPPCRVCGQWMRHGVPSLCVAPFPAVTASRSPAETTLDKMDPRQRALGTLVLSHGIILHHAPDQLSRHCTVLHLAAPRVHVEPRPPDIEESSEFPRATAGKDGFRQGGNVCSPPYHAPVGVRLTLAQLGRRARHRCWSDGSGSCKAPEPDCTRV